jgi:hypothetical protein
MLPAQMALFLPAKERKVIQKESKGAIDEQRKLFIQIVKNELNNLFKKTA